MKTNEKKENFLRTRFKEIMSYKNVINDENFTQI